MSDRSVRSVRSDQTPQAPGHRDVDQPAEDRLATVHTALMSNPFEGGARAPRVNTMFQVSNVDDGGIHWVNGDEVTQILSSSSG